MNYLAHALISPSTPLWRLGSLCADRVKGSQIFELPAEVQEGIRLHRSIDAFTDQHPLNLRLKSLVPLEFKRYTGIMLDVFGDHLLARDFERYALVEMRSFIKSVYSDLISVQALGPEKFQNDLDSMVRFDWLGSYENPESVSRMLRHLSSRLRRENPLQRAPEVLFELDPVLQDNFRAYLADTVALARNLVPESWPNYRN